MVLDKTIISNNEIILITSNKVGRQLTIDLINKWDSDNASSFLKIINIDDNSISTLEKYKAVKKIYDSKIVNDVIIKNDVFSYPSILVLRDSVLIEHIFGNYSNILDIVNFYI